MINVALVIMFCVLIVCALILLRILGDLIWEIFGHHFKAIMPKPKQRRLTMQERINALEGIGQKARKITTEIAGNYVIAVSTEAAKKKKFLCVYQSGKGLDFKKGAVHSRILVKAFPYSNEEGYVSAYKSALKHIAFLEDKIVL